MTALNSRFIYKMAVVIYPFPLFVVIFTCYLVDCAKIYQTNCSFYRYTWV